VVEVFCYDKRGDLRQITLASGELAFRVTRCDLINVGRYTPALESLPCSESTLRTYTNITTKKIRQLRRSLRTRI
jgi:hypothetical protein